MINLRFLLSFFCKSGPWFAFSLPYVVPVLLVSDVVEITSTRRRSRIPCVVVEKNKVDELQQKFLRFTYSNNAHINSGCIFLIKTEV